MPHNSYALPSEGFIRLPDVLKVIPVSRATWYRGITEGRFPRPQHLGTNLSVWNVVDIRKLISDCMNEDTAVSDQVASDNGKNLGIGAT